MMRKGLIGIFLFLGMAFLAITYLKRQPPPNSETGTPNGERTAATDSTQSRIIDFWDYYERATDLRIAGAHEEALSLYRKALSIEPDHLNSLYYQGNLLLLFGRFDEAENSWNHLVRVNPSSARAYSQLGLLYSCRNTGNPLYNLERAADHFARANSLNREETGPLLQLAKIDMLNGHFIRAEQKLEDVVSSNFRSTEALFLKGYLEWKNGRIAAAEEYLKRAAAIVSGTTEQQNVGEGDTGKDHQRSESYRCSIYTDSINRLLAGMARPGNDSRTDTIFESFERGFD